MRLDSVSAASPSGRPEIGGSGSPAPSTARPDGAGWGVPDVDPAGVAETRPTLAGLCRSGMARSVFGASIFTGSSLAAVPAGPVDVGALALSAGGAADALSAPRNRLS